MQRSRVYRQHPRNRVEYTNSEYYIIPEKPTPIQRRNNKVREAIIGISAGAVLILVLPYVFTALLLSTAIYFGWQFVNLALNKR